MNAVVLLSGGLDSATVLAMVCDQGYTPRTLSFRYGQRHAVELDRARLLAKRYGATHRVVDIDLRAFGGSALTDDIDVPKGREITDEIPVTYVPARNTIFLSFALAYAEVVGAADLFLGVNAVDYSGYPDCRPEYLAAFERLANLATKAGVEGRRLTVHAPLMFRTKAEIIRRGLELGVDYGLTSSCYDPAPEGACGECDSCQIRLAAFREVGLEDPIDYAVRA